MPRAKPFNKKTATTYALVNRPQHDPLIHDTDAPSQIFTKVASPKQTPQSKIKRRRDLEQEFNLSESIRPNEGEAAEYGIYYDDSNYDYMQHLRELGVSSDSTWIEPSEESGKGKSKLPLEDALRQFSLNESPSQYYQSQQEVPDSLAGFQPDMDPRLREVLEALDDEEYVDDDEDIFVELAADGNSEIDSYEWEANGWESDDTTKPTKEYRSTDLASSAALSSASQPPRRKKRKGALNSQSGFSMSSSAKPRTETLRLLDARFEKLAETYFKDKHEEQDEEMSQVSGITGRTGMSRISAFGGSQTSEAPSLVSGQFDAILDEFLGGPGGKKKGKVMKKAGKQGLWGQQSGMEQLDEIRKGLGPARVKTERQEASKG